MREEFEKIRCHIFGFIRQKRQFQAQQTKSTSSWPLGPTMHVGCSERPARPCPENEQVHCLRFVPGLFKMDLYLVCLRWISTWFVMKISQLGFGEVALR